MAYFCCSVGGIFNASSAGLMFRKGENSVVSRPGQYYGMCTNYAVVGEVFTKTTYKIEEKWEGTNQVFRAVVEDYQVLAEE